MLQLADLALGQLQRAIAAVEAVEKLSRKVEEPPRLRRAGVEAADVNASHVRVTTDWAAYLPVCLRSSARKWSMTSGCLSKTSFSAAEQK